MAAAIFSLLIGLQRVAGTLDDKQVMHAMSLDDMYHVEKTLARGADGVTELVTVDGAGPFVRKKMSLALANRGVWSILSLCNCSRLPRVEATYELPEQFVVVYDFIPGDTLERLVSERGRLDESEACARALEICEAASALHALGVIHRDISPKNIVMAADGARLIDLGIARMRVEGASRDTTSLGTWGYASPEQYGFAQTDARSDVYSIGRVLGFMLTGIQPDSEGYERALCDEERVSPRMHMAIERACAFEPSKRYQSVEELARALGSKTPAPAPASGVAAADSAAAASPAPSTAAAVAPADAAASGLAASQVATSHGSSRARVAAVLALVVTLVAAVAILAPRVGGLFAAPASAGGEASLGARPSSAAASDTSGAGTSGSQALVATGQAAAADGTPISEKGDLQLMETGWSMDESGYLFAVFCLRNASSSMAMTTPTVRVTARSADGSVLYTEDQGAMMLLPGESAYGSVLGDTGGKVPATVDFELLDPDPAGMTSTRAACDMTVEGATAVPDQFGGTTFAGGVRVDRASFESAYPDFISQLAVTVVLRNGAGEPIYATTTYVSPSASGVTPFSVDAYGVPDYASFDVHAQAW